MKLLVCLDVPACCCDLMRSCEGSSRGPSSSIYIYNLHRKCDRPEDLPGPAVLVRLDRTRVKGVSSAERICFQIPAARRHTIICAPSIPNFICVVFRSSARASSAEAEGMSPTVFIPTAPMYASRFSREEQLWTGGDEVWEKLQIRNQHRNISRAPSLAQQP